MRVQIFQTMVQSPRSAWRALSRRRWPTTWMRCPLCEAGPPYRLREGRWRCRRRVCGYTFGVRTGTWAGQSRVPNVTWLWLVKLFELELTASQAALQTGVSYPTALKAFTLIRRALLPAAAPDLLRREVELDESYFGPRRSSRHRGEGRGRNSPAKIPVFGILERKGRVEVTVVPDCSAESLLNATVRTVKRGSLVYTDRWKGYDTLAFCGYRHLRVDHGREFSRPSGTKKVHVNGLEGFWSYAKGKLLKFHGVSPTKFPLYLYEMQFRYNHRRDDLFELLLTATLKPLPDL
jgi:transposase